MLAAVALLAASAPFRLHFDNGEFAQVVFNLSCMSERLACTKPLIDRFWREELRWSPEDQRHLDGWRARLSTIAARAPKPQPAPFLPNYASYYPELVAVQKVLAAALDSRSPGEFRSKSAGLAQRQEIAALANAIGHFQKRMGPWWRATGSRHLDRRAKPFEAGMRDPKFAALAAKIARFMQSGAASGDFYVHLIARGDPASDRSTGTFLRNHIFLEVTDKMTPEAAHTIVMHEMTHAFYDLAPRAKHQQLIKEFADSREPHAQSYYTLLNEGLATGVQFMLLRQAGKPDEDAYRHAYIPRMGRAVSPLMEHALNDENATLFGGFVEPYLQAGAAEMKDDAGSPRFALLAVAMGLVGQTDLKAAGEAFRAELPTLAWADFGDRQLYPQVNLAMLVAYPELGAIASNWEEVPQLAKQHRGFAFIAPRGDKGRVFVLAGQDGAAVVEVVRKLAEATSMPDRGLLVSLPATGSPAPPAR